MNTSVSSFSSDSTYCSLYENIQQSQKTKCKILTDSKALNTIYKAVSNHWEAKKLVGRVEAVQYLKKISKMNLKNIKDQCLAKRIKSSLYKIYHLTKQFEESFNIDSIPPVVDPMENVSLSEDLIPANVEHDPKQILLKSTSVNDETSSFPLELLTNNNFISSSCLNLCDPINKNQMEEGRMEKLVEDKSRTLKSNISNILSLESSEVYIQNYFPCSIEKASTEKERNNKGESTFCENINNKSQSNISTNLSSENTEAYIQSLSPRFNEEVSTTRHTKSPNVDETTDNNTKAHVTKYTEKYDLELDPNYNNNSTSVKTPKHQNINLIHSAESYTMLQISSICAYLSTSGKDNSVQICETVNFGKENLPVNIWNPDLKTLLDLGNLFNESHNKYFYTLCRETDDNFSKGKTWLETENNFTSGQFIAQHVNTTLEKSFEKLLLSEYDSSQSQTETKDVHSFSEEDQQKLNLEELIKSNQARLEQISIHFQSYLCSKQTKFEDEDTDLQLPDWKVD